jgi:hypothetical protein
VEKDDTVRLLVDQLAYLLKENREIKQLLNLERCPDCFRPKTRNANDCFAGCCAKWYAVNDLEAQFECTKLKAFWNQTKNHSVDDLSSKDGVTLTTKDNLVLSFNEGTSTPNLKFDESNDQDYGVVGSGENAGSFVEDVGKNVVREQEFTVPRGYVLTRLDVNEVMCIAGYEACRNEDGTHQFADAGFCLGHAVKIYKAMIEASTTSIDFPDQSST